MNAPMRKFTAEDADVARARGSVPLLIGLMGSSGSGKTFSALRLAEGIQSINGGDIYVVDTEQRRSLHYSDRFKFKHVQFGEPFGALDYLAALRWCKSQGAGVIVIDSCSHEHDGPGGMLEQHDAELTRMAGQDYGKRERMTMLAWQKPKQARRQLINAITTEIAMPVIFCFRSKNTTKPIKDPSDGKLKPIDMGFTPIAGDEWLFEMSLNALLLPGSRGVPTWNSDKPGERAMIKLPEQFLALADKPVPFSQAIGKRLAQWAAGGPAEKQERRQPEPEQGPADDQRGESHTALDAEADILAHLARKTTVIDANSLISSRIGELDEDGQDRVRSALMDKIAELKAPK